MPLTGKTTYQYTSMDKWSAPPRPNTYAEKMLISAILDGSFSPGDTLPGERTLAHELGITRPTLREAIQRLARDGWLTVRQGKPTVVNDFWREGGLNVLNTLVHHGGELPPGFVTHLLEVRLQLAPAYTKEAIAREPAAVATFTAGHVSLGDDAPSFARFDWDLHHLLTVSSGNPIYTLILNGFNEFYEELARIYFVPPAARTRSRHFYAALFDAANAQDSQRGEAICRETMADSIVVWHQARSAERYGGIKSFDKESYSEQN
ncbi:MAG: fatty acid metabolism transcriptional regulator FadR [Candidatus Promineifilaceae bacterium]